jgi:hypothetical protein
MTAQHTEEEGVKWQQSPSDSQVNLKICLQIHFALLSHLSRSSHFPSAFFNAIAEVREWWQNNCQYLAGRDDNWQFLRVSARQLDGTQQSEIASSIFHFLQPGCPYGVSSLNRIEILSLCVIAERLNSGLFICNSRSGTGIHWWIISQICFIALWHPVIPGRETGILDVGITIGPEGCVLGICLIVHI